MLICWRIISWDHFSEVMMWAYLIERLKGRKWAGLSFHCRPCDTVSPGYTKHEKEGTFTTPSHLCALGQSLCFGASFIFQENSELTFDYWCLNSKITLGEIPETNQLIRQVISKKVRRGEVLGGEYDLSHRGSSDSSSWGRTALQANAAWTKTGKNMDWQAIAFP